MPVSPADCGSRDPSLPPQIFELFNANDTVRSFVVHEGEDDLGLGNAVGSLTTGWLTE